MDTLDYIESYFTKEPDADRTREFEERIKSDPVFAEEVAFYLAAQEVSREKYQVVKKEHFKEIYKNKQVVRIVPFRKLVYYIATAAAVAGIIFGTNIFFKPVSTQQIAAQYEKEHLQTLPVTMSGHADSLQTGLSLYNDGKYSQALGQFEAILKTDTSVFSAKEYAGITALRLKDYDKALSYFGQMEMYNGLYSNRALLMQAVTLMERNLPGDSAKAKLLLQKIVADDLEGKEFAQEWLKKM
jgi:hypothetical protein